MVYTTNQPTNNQRHHHHHDYCVEDYKASKVAASGWMGEEEERERR